MINTTYPSLQNHSSLPLRSQLNMGSNRKHVLLIANTLIFLLSLSPALAQTQAKAIHTHSKKISCLNLLRLPKAVAGFCTGFVVGIPICFVKKMPGEIADGAHGVAEGITNGGNTNKVLFTSAAILWLPAATITSFIDAPCYSFKNALTANKPFSKEQFSLDDFEKKPSSEL